jgi:hypothetical protein
MSPGAKVWRRFDRLASNSAVRLCYKESGREKSFNAPSAGRQDLAKKKWPISGQIQMNRSPGEARAGNCT